MKYFFIILLGTVLAGCYQIQSDGDDLRTTPTTNNPNIIQDKSQRMPGIGY